MGDPKGFINVRRIDNGYRPVNVRLLDFAEIERQLPEIDRELQASRCMDCGVPFCHWACPVANVMPEWQDKIHKGDWNAAYEILQSTNNFPEITGRVCPAPCEASCVLGIHDDPVTIRQNELAVIERAFKEGYVVPKPPQHRTGKNVAVIGSGPAGLACADNLNKAGHSVVIYEAAEAAGGYLRYGIPDFKLNKAVIDRRLDILIAEGIEIRTGVEIGKDLGIEEITAEFDATCITIGARKPRDLNVEGRELDGVHFAMEFLGQNNRLVQGADIPEEERITAQDKHVIVIGGGDTGADCVGTANRQGAKSVRQMEILPQPPVGRRLDQPWPLWPNLLKVSSSHLEGCERLFSASTQQLHGTNGRVERLSAVQVAWHKEPSGRYVMENIPGTEIELKADLVLLAMGFVHALQDGLIADLGLELDGRGNVAVGENYMTNVDGVFAAGDTKRGASLVVWAIREGQEAAQGIDEYLANKA